jgi:hypothetical protein
MRSAELSMILSRTIRHRLEAQGFCNLDDPTMPQLAPWLRWSPSLCATVIATGVTLRAPLVLWGLAVIAVLGAVLPFHPFDLLYNYFVRRFTGTASLPRHAAQRRFACALATVWLVATGWAFYIGAAGLGLVLGSALFAVALLVSITHICIPSMIYNALFSGRSVLAPKVDDL